MQRRHAVSSRATRFAIAVALAITLASTAAVAQEVTKAEMQGLDDQVQQVKEDVIGIAGDLHALEEKLLYPSGTQVAVFVALDGGEGLRLDSAKVRIDGKPVARYVYSQAEVDALRKGGVQHIYTGNLPSGQHHLEVAFAGKTSGGGDLDETKSFTFTKGVKPEVLGATLSGSSGGARIEIGEW